MVSIVQKASDDIAINFECGHSVTNYLFSLRNDLQNSIAHFKHGLAMLLWRGVVHLFNVRRNAFSHS